MFTLNENVIIFKHFDLFAKENCLKHHSIHLEICKKAQIWSL